MTSSSPISGPTAAKPPSPSCESASAANTAGTAEGEVLPPASPSATTCTETAAYKGRRFQCADPTVARAACADGGEAVSHTARGAVGRSSAVAASGGSSPPENATGSGHHPEPAQARGESRANGA